MTTRLSVLAFSWRTKSRIPVGGRLFFCEVRVAKVSWVALDWDLACAVGLCSSRNGMLRFAFCAGDCEGWISISTPGLSRGGYQGGARMRSIDLKSLAE